VQPAPDPAHGTTNAPSTPTPAIDPDRPLARSKRFAQEIVGLEGGISDRSPAEDPGGLTRYGVTRDTFDDWLPRHKLDGRPPVPVSFEQVDAADAVRIIREVAYDDYKLDQIEDDRLAHQLMDIFANTSRKGAYPIVQAAVQEVMGKHGLYRHKKDVIGLDQPVGPITRARMNWLVRKGFGPALKNALVEHRLAAARHQPHYKHNPGWVRRFRRFLEPMRDI
jgi:lysozyme family protein